MNTDPVDPGLVGLNEPQREAVLHATGPLVVFAGAGSGKTRVITHRVAHLVQKRGVPPWSILAVTFTNKAAKEMKERLERLIGGSRTRDLWVGTFHATWARLCRRYHEAMGVRRDFSIYDDADSRAMVKRVMRDLKIDERQLTPKLVAGRIARAKQEVNGPDAIDIRYPLDEIVREIYTTYEQRMALSGALDFADLLYRPLLAIEGNAELRGELTKRFRYLLVDEFQDTNHVQYRLVRALSAEHRNVTVVGDDDQSIYRWRGADRRNILNFREEFPDAEVIKLEQNYRSSARILRAANAVISRATHREPKELWTDNAEGAPITVLTCADERREAAFVVQAVMQFREVGRSLEEITLFYRIHAQSRVFEEELRRQNVPYRILGGMRFYDRAEIKDLLAYLRILANPEDDVSLLRIINTPTRGIGKKTLEALMDRAAREGTGLWAALEKAAAGSGGSSKRLAAFVSLIGELRMELAAERPLAAVGYKAYESSGYKTWLTDQDTPEADARMQNIEELLGAMQEAQESDPELDLPAFLERVTLESAADAEGEAVEEKLTLMTVHAAKGLEFPVVIVSGMEEDMFPFRRTEEPLDAEELGEERRLAYVALTRAQDRLLLTHALRRRLFRDEKLMRPSRFLSELPSEDVERLGDRASPRRSESRARRGGYGGGGYSGGGYSGFSGRKAKPKASPRIRPGDSYVDPTEGSDFAGRGVEVGMRVEHKKFGMGRIIQVKASIPPRVDVEFRDEDGDPDVRTIDIRYLSPA